MATDQTYAGKFCHSIGSKTNAIEENTNNSNSFNKINELSSDGSQPNWAYCELKTAPNPLERIPDRLNLAPSRFAIRLIRSGEQTLRYVLLRSVTLRYGTLR